MRQEAKKRSFLLEKMIAKRGPSSNPDGERANEVAGEQEKPLEEFRIGDADEKENQEKIPGVKPAENSVVIPRESPVTGLQCRTQRRGRWRTL